jgi:hypothetical protein
LQRLIVALPGVAEQISSFSLGELRDRLTAELEEAGLEVRIDSLERHRSLGGVPEQYLLHALRTAADLVTQNEATLDKDLTKFWGREQDSVLSYLYTSDHETALLGDTSLLLESSHTAAERLSGRTHSYHSMLACATLVHHIAKATGNVDVNLDLRQNRPSAFIRRSAAMGQIINTNNLDAVRKYAREVQTEHVMQMVEEWALPSYCRDLKPSPDFTLSRRMSLYYTSREVIQEVGRYNDAYLFYLVSVYIPLALERDPEFGGNLLKLISVIELRLERCSDPLVRKAAAALVLDLKRRTGSE